jgi:rubrerythrin
MTTLLEQDVKLAESVGIQDEFGEDYKATILQIHAFANAIREQAVLKCLEIVKQNTYEPDPYDRYFDEQAAAYRKSEEIYDDIKSHFKIKTAAPTSEDGKDALRDLVTKAVTEAVNEYSDYHYEGNEPDISNTVDRVLESK